MGRISAHIRITNFVDRSKSIEIDCLVDTGSAYMVLPMAWRDRLGELSVARQVECETATQQVITGLICGPVELQIEGFVPVYGEVMFLDMEPSKDRYGHEHYEPLLGYIPLEQSQAAVDMMGHRLLHVRKVDLK